MLDGAVKTSVTTGAGVGADNVMVSAITPGDQTTASITLLSGPLILRGYCRTVFSLGVFICHLQPGSILHTIHGGSGITISRDASFCSFSAPAVDSLNSRVSLYLGRQESDYNSETNFYSNKPDNRIDQATRAGFDPDGR